MSSFRHYSNIFQGNANVVVSSLGSYCFQSIMVGLIDFENIGITTVA